jgi:hypothetical protein
VTPNNKDMPSKKGFYGRIKRESIFDQSRLAQMLSQVEQNKVTDIGNSLAKYIKVNLSGTIDSRQGLSDYKTNPYVLMTSASSMKWSSIEDFAAFLFNSKLYAGLETSFGKSIESIFLDFYPTKDLHWENPKEKIQESKLLTNLSPEEKARVRNVSVWREIDRSVVVGNKRYLLLIKSGPHCINDTQVEAMKTAITEHHEEWYNQTKINYPQVEQLDVIVGITYGTEKTTNNKENQILIKLLENGFVDSGDSKGTLYNLNLPKLKVYRVIGRDFWALVGNPLDPDRSQHVFVEVLLGLLDALKKQETDIALENLVNNKIEKLAQAIRNLALPPGAIPEWLSKKYSENELLWLLSALSSFFD